MKELTADMFEIKQVDPEAYRRETRRSTLIVVLVFAVLAMGLASLFVKLFGEPGGDNFRWNLGGVIAGLLLAVLLVRLKLWCQPWMASAAYGWQLKRSLMSVTNVMHHVTAGVAAGDPSAMKLLRFYHLGLMQMHQLDGNSSSLNQMLQDVEEHQERMRAQQLDTDQTRLDPSWFAALKNVSP